MNNTLLGVFSTSIILCFSSSCVRDEDGRVDTNIPEECYPTEPGDTGGECTDDVSCIDQQRSNLEHRAEIQTRTSITTITLPRVASCTGEYRDACGTEIGLAQLDSHCIATLVLPAPHRELCNLQIGNEFYSALRDILIELRSSELKLSSVPLQWIGPGDSHVTECDDRFSVRATLEQETFQEFSLHFSMRDWMRSQSGTQTTVMLHSLRVH